MRYLPDIIDKVIALIPKEEDPRGIKPQLESVKDSALYAPPEGQAIWWQRFAEILNYNLPYPPVEPWQMEIHSLITQTYKQHHIWCNRPNDQPPETCSQCKDLRSKYPEDLPEEGMLTKHFPNVKDRGHLPSPEVKVTTETLEKVDPPAQRCAAFNIQEAKYILQNHPSVACYIADLNTMRIAMVLSVEEAQHFSKDDGTFTITSV